MRGTHLFFRDDRPAKADALLLLEITEALLYGDEPARLQEDLMQFGNRTIEQLRPRLLRGELPPLTLEVLTAISLIAHPKDYNAAPCWNTALALADSLPAPHPRVTDKEADARNRELVAFSMWLGGLVRRAQAGQSLDEQEREIALCTLTLGPLGLCAQTARPFVMAYPVIHTMSVNDPYWLALADVIQVLMGNDDALRTLGALVEANPRSPSLLWLDELLCRLDGQESRADQQAERIQARLAEGDLGTNAPKLCAQMLSFSRRFITRDKDPAGAAWPFRTKHRLPEVNQAIDEVAHYIAMTFRMLRGIELLAPSSQQLARRLSAGNS